MRVLDTETGQFVEVDPLTTEYAILSHTWDRQNGEQTYAQLKRIQDRYILGPGARPTPHKDTSDRQDNLSSTSKPPDSPSSAIVPTSPPPLAIPEASSTTTLPSEHTALLADHVRPTGGQDQCSRLSGPWKGLLQFLLLVMGSMARFVARVVEVLGDVPQPDSPLALPDPVLARVIVHDNVASPADESSPPPPASSPTSHVTSVPESIWDDPELSPKIKMACAIAREAGYWYIWIDSCCIDKTSSSELSEAINSMYAWYGDARICYAYLADVPPGETTQSEDSDFRRSRWFTRGWTLQELIAPAKLVFLCAEWETIGSKHDLVDVLEEITGIDRDALLLDGTDLNKFSVAQRFSWASMRETERVEDHAYSLMGLFDINMPTLYGEGERAFRRLQEEILRRTPDQSLFAWGNVWKPFTDVDEELDEGASVPRAKKYQCAACFSTDKSSITSSVDNFVDAGTITSVPHHEVRRRLQLSDLSPTEYTFTSYGIRMQLPVLPLSAVLHPNATAVPHGHSISQWYLAILGCEDGRYPDHLLGRVCRILPSESGIDLLYAGWIKVPGQAFSGMYKGPSMLALSPAVVERCVSQTELMTIYISHPARRARNSPRIQAQFEPHSSIALRPSKETLISLRAEKYTVSLRRPDDAHPTTHRLTLSHADHTISIEYNHTLEAGGSEWTMRVHLEVSQGRQPSTGNVQSTVSSGVTWSDSIVWRIWPCRQYVTVRIGGKKLTLKLGLEFIGKSRYSLVVEIYRPSDAALAGLSLW